MISAPIQIDYLALAGNAAACVLAVIGLTELLRARRTAYPAAAVAGKHAADEVAGDHPRPGLADLALLAFIASLVFMALEMVAGRLVQRHLGSSVYGWTSVIGVLLAGLSFGNFLGGKIADFVKSEKQASWLFMAASILVLAILLLETQPAWLADHAWGGAGNSFMSQAISTSRLVLGPVQVSLSWPFRILFVVTCGLSAPRRSPWEPSARWSPSSRSTACGSSTARAQRSGRSTLGDARQHHRHLPDRLFADRHARHQGSDLGPGHGTGLRRNHAGLDLARDLGWHSPGPVRAGVHAPLFIDLIGQRVFPVVKGDPFKKIGDKWGIREEMGSPDSEHAWIDESDYYFIKISNELELGNIVKRTLVLDNLIHGYFILDHPERLDYDYEHIYALVAYRAIKAGGKVTFKPRPEPAKDAAGAAVTRPGSDTKTGKEDVPKSPDSKDDAAKPVDTKSTVPDDLNKRGRAQKRASLERRGKNGKVVPGDVVTDKGKETSETPEEPEDRPHSSLPAVEDSTLTTLFLGGGAYCFQRHMQYAYPGTAVDVAEIDPAVTRANFMATGLPRNTKIQTYWGDARQFVELHQDTKKYDIVFGDAFNDFSVPWHLTTREFNEKIKKMLTPNGVYMINIIDAYMSDAEAENRAESQIGEVAKAKAKDRSTDDVDLDPAEQERIRKEVKAEAYRYGGFVGAWTRTARLTFDHVYIFGTDSVPGSGDRETFVVVASNQELDLNDLGRRVDDPKFYKGKRRTTPKPFGPADEQAIERRSRKIVLTDDYAPVDNLLAPVAETREKDDD